MGVATPTEAGALGAVGAMLLAWLNGRLSKDNLEEALDYSATDDDGGIFTHWFYSLYIGI